MPSPDHRHLISWPFALLLAVALTGCGAMSGTGKKSTMLAKEDFGSTTTYERPYGTEPARACEAARRAMLSQGYAITTAAVDSVTGRKNFQPSPELQASVDIHAVCTPDGPHSSIVFVNAVQDRYGLKKSNNSASVGVGVIGSLSLPFTAGDDSMVKIGSETVQDAIFYERFFLLVERYLPEPWVEPAAAVKAAQ
jgi:hypothetical protein